LIQKIQLLEKVDSKNSTQLLENEKLKKQKIENFFLL